MNEGAAQPATRCGVVIDRTSDPHPGLAQPTEVKWRRAFAGKGSHLSPMRRWLMSVLPTCPALEDVLSVTNELATNAICHTRTGRGGWFAVEVTWTLGLVRVAVADLGGTSVPKLCDDPEGVHGRGLVLVQALSVRTGTLGNSNGRTVWAEIAWEGPKPEQPTPIAPSSSTTGEDEPMTTTLSAAQAIADTLTGSDFDVRSPAWADAVTLKVTNARSAFCELTIGSDGKVTWDYSTYDGRHTSAAHLISIVLDLLSPAWDDTTSIVRLPIVPDLTLKGVVGRALVEGGMRVALSQPHTDQQFFDAYAEITVTNPAEPGRGAVSVADHGAISWECQVHEVAGRSGGLSVNQIAATIIQALSRTHRPCCLV